MSLWACTDFPRHKFKVAANREGDGLRTSLGSSGETPRFSFVRFRTSQSLIK